MIPGFFELFNSTRYRSDDPKFEFLSNWSKFQHAKYTGEIKDSYHEYVEFFRFEYDHKRRPEVMRRLFSLANSCYKQVVFQELIHC